MNRGTTRALEETWTTLRVLEWTTEKFGREGIESARLEAQVLLAHVLHCDRVGLYMVFDKPMAPGELAGYRKLIKRRLAGEPVAYLVGEQEFWSLPFTVDPRVLIPRADTETLIEVVLDLIDDRSAEIRVADIGTGSGAIAITLAHELSNARVVATDVSADALNLATANAKRNQLTERVELRKGSLLEPLAGERVHILAANLPYIPTAEIPGLQTEVTREPHGALDGGPDGLDLIRALISEAATHLEPGGHLVLEHGHDQAERIARLIAATGSFAPATLRADLGGNPRITSARLA